MSGTVLFNPNLESDALLRRWLVYRNPTLDQWVLSADRANLIRESVRDMLLFGGSPALGTFVDFDVSSVSTSFLASWLSWYGVIPASDTDIGARSEAWWRQVAGERLEEMRHSPLLARFRADSQAESISGSVERMVAALSATTVARDRLMHGFESLDRHTINHLAPREFNVLLRMLAQRRFPQDPADVLSAKTVEEMQEYNTAYRLFRSTRAIASRTGTAMVDLKHYVELKKGELRERRAQLATDSDSSNLANGSFWLKHGIGLALKSAEGLEGAVKVAVVSGSVKVLTHALKNKLADWENADSVVRQAVLLIKSLHAKEMAGTAAATAALITALRSRKKKPSAAKQVATDTLISGFLQSFLNAD